MVANQNHRIVKRAKQAGELKNGASPADLARSLLVMTQGLLLLNKNKNLRDSGITDAVLRTSAALISP